MWSLVEPFTTFVVPGRKHQLSSNEMFECSNQEAMLKLCMLQILCWDGTKEVPICLAVGIPEYQDK